VHFTLIGTLIVFCPLAGAVMDVEKELLPFALIEPNEPDPPLFVYSQLTVVFVVLYTVTVTFVDWPAYRDSDCRSADN
jgi:hypothetical protein